MRLGSYIIAGIATLTFASTAFAAAPPACTGPAGDCDNDTIADVDDPCPWVPSASHGGDSDYTFVGSTNTTVVIANACIDATNLTVGDGVVFGGPVWIDAGTSTVTIGANSDIGAFTKLNGLGDTTLAPKTLLADAPSPDNGTSMNSGFLGRRDEVGYDPAATPDPAKQGNVTIGSVIAARAVTIGYGAILGDNISLGYGVTVGPRAVLRDGATVGNLGSVGFGAVLGQNSRLGRESSIGNFAVVGDNVRVAPDVTIGTYAEIGEQRCSPQPCTGAPVPGAQGIDIRIRRGSTIGKWTKVAHGARIGRNNVIGAYATIEGETVLRAGSTVGDGAVVNDQSPEGSNGFFQRGSNIAGNPANVPEEPNGTFFSAAGGIVCDDANGDNQCTRIPVYASGNVGSQGPANGQDEVVRYCLDEVAPFDSCDASGIQAITITAPDTIGVSPYCDSSGCHTVQNANYQLQAGPIYVLSPPTP